MGLFTRKISTAQVGTSPIGAQAGSSQVGNFLTYSIGASELLALQVPTVSRAKDLLSSMIGALEFKHYTKQWTGEEYEEIYLPLEPWMESPDPNVTRNFLLANTFSDLFFTGRCFWYVKARNAATGLPTEFEWIPSAMITTPNQVGPQFFGKPDSVLFNGLELDPKNIICFLSPIIGLTWTGYRAINIALHLDQAVDRYASLETTAGYLQQRSGETLSGEELTEIASVWASARKVNAIGALNDFVEFVEFKNDPSEMLNTQRQYEALELARIANIPPYLVGVEVGGMTYQNAQQARQDLYLFGAKPYIDCIQQTLSMNNVLAPNRFVELNIEDFIGSEDMSEMGREMNTPNNVEVMND
jgi:hypothetical protein